MVGLVPIGVNQIGHWSDTRRCIIPHSDGPLILELVWRGCPNGATKLADNRGP